MIITITGPRSVGKSTISKLVAKKLKLKYISSDEIGERAMKKEGGLNKAIKSGAIEKFIEDSAYSLIRKEYRKNNFVFDLSGGSISSRKFPEASKKVRKIAKLKSTIIGLLPYKDKEKSIKLLFTREKERRHFKEIDSKEIMKKTKKDYKKFPRIFKNFCNIIIYTNGKNSSDIAELITKELKN